MSTRRLDAPHSIEVASDLDQSFEDWLTSLAPPSKKTGRIQWQQFEVDQSLEINFEGELIVSGYVAGTVQSTRGTLIVTSSGTVVGDISVENAVIQGTVQGEISASGRVELGASARVIGDVETNAIEIQPGAIFEGRCSFGRDSATQAKGMTELDSSSLPL